jgi:hypothetical protein
MDSLVDDDQRRGISDPKDTMPSRGSRVDFE